MKRPRAIFLSAALLLVSCGEQNAGTALRQEVKWTAVAVS